MTKKLIKAGTFKIEIKNSDSYFGEYKELEKSITFIYNIGNNISAGGERQSNSVLYLCNVLKEWLKQQELNPNLPLFRIPDCGFLFELSKESHKQLIKDLEFQLKDFFSINDVYLNRKIQ